MSRIMNPFLRGLALSIALISANKMAMAAAPGISTHTLGKADLVDKKIAVAGKVVSALAIEDKHGEHILVLTSARGPSLEQPGRGRIERTDLRATYHSKVDGKWREEWAIKDGVDCPMLDFEAMFFSRYVAVSDVNGDGIAEVTVPYKLFCGGGVDVDIVKVILRHGPEKYAVRGESLVRLKGQEDFGGSYKADASLTLPQNAAFRKQLLKVWKQVYIRVDS